MNTTLMKYRLLFLFDCNKFNLPYFYSNVMAITAAKIVPFFPFKKATFVNFSNDTIESPLSMAVAFQHVLWIHF